MYNAMYNGNESEILGVISERLLGPFGHEVHRLSVATNLLVKRRILVFRQQLVFFGEVKLQGIDLLETGGYLVLRFE